MLTARPRPFSRSGTCLLLPALFACCTASDGGVRDLDGGLTSDAEGPSPEDAGPGIDSGDEDSGASVDTGPEDDAMQVAGFEGTLVLNDSARMEATGGARVGAISIEDNVGTFVFDGEEVPAVVYVNMYWDLAESQTFTVLGVAAGRLIVLFPYCSVSGQMTQVWYETTDGAPVTRELAAGSCTTTPDVTSSAVAFPDVRIPRPVLLDGFTIDGPDIRLDDTGPGTIELSGVAWELLPFNVVDCSDVCGDPGAWELHSILWDAEAQAACFGIVYLQDPPADFVWFDLALCLPSLDRPSAVLDATYSIP